MAIVIQSAEVTFNTFTYLQNYTIANVGDITKCRVEIQVNPASGSTDVPASCFSVSLSSTTNLEFRREWYGGGQPLTVYYQIIKDDDQTVQWGESTMSTSPTNITISNVGSLSNAYSIVYFRCGNSTLTLSEALNQHYLNTTTQLTNWIGGYAKFPIGVYQIVKSNLISVQSIQGTATGTQVFPTVSTIDMSKTMILLAFDGYGAALTMGQMKICNYDTTTTFRIAGYTSASIDYTLYVISDDRLKVQTGYGALTANLNPIAITSVDTAKTFTRLYGDRGFLSTVNSATLNLGQDLILAKLDSAIQVNVRRSNNGGAAFAIPWAVIEYTEGGVLYPFLNKVGMKIGINIGAF